MTIKKKPAVKKAAKNKPADLQHNWRRLKGAPVKKVTKVPTTISLVDVNKVLDEIRKDKACHVVCAYPDTVVFIKRIDTIVNKTNNNNIFQPHDYSEAKVYCVMGMIEFNKPERMSASWPHVADIKALGCPVFRIGHHSEVGTKLKELN